MIVIAVFASSLDGHIASGVDPHSRIGSAADLQHLRNVRDQGDAVFCGGETFREYPYVRRGNNKDQRMVHGILTRSFDLPPEAPLFKVDPPVPIMIFSPQPVPDEVRERYPAHVEWITVGQQGNPVPAILRAYQRHGATTLLMEGGGLMMNLFLQAKVLDELYLTLCPLFLGTEGAANLLTGPGFAVAEAPRTEILSLHQIENEVYLHLKLAYP